MRALIKRMRSRNPALAVSMLLLAAVFSLAPAQQSERTLVFRNIDVFDGSRMTRHTNVLVRAGMIRAVGPDVATPPAAQVIDGKGKTLLSGLFDSHTHLGITQGEQFLQDALDFGVTTELEMWGSDASLALRKKIADQELTDIADLRTAGVGITVPKGHPSQMGGPPFPVLGR